MLKLPHWQAMPGRVTRVPHRVRHMIHRVRRRLHDWWRGETDATFFDIFELNRVNTQFVQAGFAPIQKDVQQANESRIGALRWILARLATEPGLRHRHANGLFPEGYSRFAQTLLQSTGLTPTGRENIQAAFDGEPINLPYGIWRSRGDLRDVFPLGVTPHPQRELLLHWFLHHGLKEFGLLPEESLWFLMALDLTPDRGLMRTYYAQPEWQRAVPEGATSLGWPKLKQYLQEHYGLFSRWFQLAQPDSPFPACDEVRILQSCTNSVPAPTERAIHRWLGQQPGLAKPSASWSAQLRDNLNSGFSRRPGVNVLAHFSYPSGLQEAAVGVCQGLNQVQWRVATVDYTLTMPANLRKWRPGAESGYELFDTTIQVTAVNIFPEEWLGRIGLAARSDVYRIAVWYWELEELPPEWLDQMAWADEVWAPTSFLEKTFQKYLNVPVQQMLPGVELPTFTRKSRAELGLRDDRFLFYFSFDMGSVMQRKNPLGLIRAFQKAFRRDDPVQLVIKVSRGQVDPESFAKLEQAAEEAGVQLINQVLSRNDTLAMLDSADCYVSLHRAEGLGLGMAESMLLGKPVIGTRYSGNLDFMTDSTSYLVEAGRVAIEQEATLACPYPKGCIWADPNLDHAAELMRQVFQNRDEAAAIGQAAQLDLEQRLSLKSYGQRMAAALRAVRHGSRETPAADS